MKNFNLSAWENTSLFKPETKIAQALGWLDPITGSIPPSIHLGVTYARTPDYERRSGNMAYSRDDGNPLFHQAEQLMSELEGGRDSLIFSSGMAASTAVFQILEPGDHVVVPEIMYFGLTKWLLEFGKKQGLLVDRVPTGNLSAMQAALKPGKTKIVWIETPCNPTWQITDIAASAEIAHAVKAKLVVDSTVSTPVITNPISLGADLVMHSATKYLNGHTDVIAGFLVTAQEDEFWERLLLHRKLSGCIPGPLETYLLLRGMRTLYPRMRMICETAMKLAEYFEGHPEVTKVSYPGLPSHIGHEIAKRQMKNGFSGMMSLHIKGDWERSLNVAKCCKLFFKATSLGGVESCVEHRYTFEGKSSLSPKDMIRISIGLEHVDDLIQDLEQAIQQT